MEKPIIYIIVEEGLVQNVFVKAPFGANAEVVLCDFDTTDPDVYEANLKTLEEARETAHLVY